MNTRAAGDIYRPDVECRSADEQRARDGATYCRQLDYLFAASAFYRDKLAAAGFDTAASAGGLDDIAALPFTEKDEIRQSQAQHPPLGAHLAASRDKLVRIYSTSGTTGDPTYMPLTAADLAAWIEISSRSYYAAGIRPGMSIVTTYNAGPFVAGAAIDALNALGVCHIPVGTGNTARLTRALQLLKPQALVCTPSYAMYLTEHLAQRGIVPDQLGLKRICVAGEPGGGEPQIREHLQKTFNAKLCEAMGIGDVSVSLWGECEAQDGMHFSGRDFVHAELIDPEDGKPVSLEDGAQGELVYTALRREAAPLLRFRSRDHVTVKVSCCSCGRTSLRARCIGRTDDMLIVRGVNVFPSAVRSIVAEFTPQVSGAVSVRPKLRGVRQEPPLPLVVELAPDVPPREALAHDIEQAIRARLVASVRVELAPFGTLPRSEYKTKLVDFSAAANG
ncbi:MAG TPA: AMP-binding protein [Pseudolabrys sp.]|nr:AMP-binding protein [Pseudolabrys sp.]